MDVYPRGTKVLIRENLLAHDGAKSWAAGREGLVMESRPGSNGAFGDVRVHFSPCAWCFRSHRCAAFHWIKIEDLAPRRPLDVVFDHIPD